MPTKAAGQHPGTSSRAPAGGVPVTPRWEWRIFERALRLPVPIPPSALGPAGAASEETYILSLMGRHNVKVRDGRLDIKRLERVDTAGLELWRPVLQVQFPIDALHVDDLWAAWELPAPPFPRRSYTLDSLLRDVVTPHPELVALDVTKRRARVELPECRGERATIDVHGERWETLSFEDEDPARVLAAVRSLGLDELPNVNYPKALKNIATRATGSSRPIQGVV